MPTQDQKYIETIGDRPFLFPGPVSHILKCSNTMIMGGKGIHVNSEGSNQIIWVFKNRGFMRLIAKIVLWFKK